jgi:hypothetical protein
VFYSCELLLLFSVVLLKSCLNLALGLLYTEHLRNGDQWKAIDGIIGNYVFARIFFFARLAGI